ncbi:Crotonobetainyl-CoA:carnitine CoA-transferase CaiB [Erythrobacter litoralis]|jgi:crotonobetainyl-CoA:carnitine CoA-transferase CaiB-like acyl-CoA transferase|uniref:CoA-transferase n=1 Tax=Erythrobacter litoralis TaxID=39960 RepID=A0A074M878_9SPHN|nr:CaiB/BaiF CoA-transferase family protein [Erythrobacter litoralis]AOL22305.1 Crotonobetainyl-CoA:carnitine CoA-transferase CaiB [Erythrobacter litoralis]KEO89594.1 CoA-transferase [Erythrobacter litoralis]MEE4339434.1 CaiB/BaiF CoA-transferase family protein [Erythrobacter sp.]
MWLDHPRNPDAPLAGLRVVELARVLAGPYAGQVLADLGADVIKVESPEGDGTRAWGPPWIERAGPAGETRREAAYYHACNRGKRGITADFRNPDDLARARDLCLGADVVIENFKTGSLTKFGLDYAALARENDRLVYCSITGFGQTGPRAHEAGYDFVVQGMSGFMSLTGEPEGTPVKMGISISDLATGVWAVNGIQAALLMRERTGKGQHVDMSLMDCSIALLSNQATYHFTTGENPPRMGNAHAQVAPYGVFPVKDGYVILAPANDRLFHKLADLLGRNDWSGDPRFAHNGERVANAKALDAEIAAATAAWTKEALLDACHAAGVPAGPINRLDEVFADPQVAARGMKVEPGGMAGVRSPFTFSGAQLALDRPSPLLGEHDPED